MRQHFNTAPRYSAQKTLHIRMVRISIQTRRNSDWSNGNLTGGLRKWTIDGATSKLGKARSFKPTLCCTFHTHLSDQTSPNLVPIAQSSYSPHSVGIVWHNIMVSVPPPVHRDRRDAGLPLYCVERELLQLGKLVDQGVTVFRVDQGGDFGTEIDFGNGLLIAIFGIEATVHLGSGIMQPYWIYISLGVYFMQGISLNPNLKS